MRWEKFTFGDLADRGSSRSTPLRESVMDSAKFHLSICNMAILHGDQFEQNLIGGEGIVEEEQQQAADFKDHNIADEMWISDTSDGEARLLRSRSGYSASPTLCQVLW